MELLTKKEIAEHLGLYTVNGIPNIHAVTFALQRIDADPIGKKERRKAYSPAVLPEIRKFFWNYYHGNLPEFIFLGNRKYQVVYRPDDSTTCCAV